MSEGLPTDRQLAALEQRVLERIHRRAAIRARVVSGVAAAALVVGGIVLVHPSPVSVSGGASGSAGSAAKAPSPAAVVRCHATSAADSTVRTVPLPDRPTIRAIAAACAAMDTATGRTPGPSAATGHRPPVVCRSAKGVWEVFPDDGHPSTLCERNGLDAG